MKSKTENVEEEEEEKNISLETTFQRMKEKCFVVVVVGGTFFPRHKQVL